MNEQVTPIITGPRNGEQAKSPHPAVPATFSPREKERTSRRVCNSTVKRDRAVIRRREYSERLAPCRVCLPGSIIASSIEGGTMTTKTPTQYQHLEPRPGSNYRQFFLKGRRIRAAVVDEAIHGPDPRTPEEFARDYQLPLEAILEALDYVAQNRPLIEQERDREAAKLRARGFDGPAQG